MRGITKTFPGVRALDKVDFDLEIGEIHTLVGENGAGKSTLIKVLSGAHKRDSGIIEINGKNVHITSPRDAIRYGIYTVQQHFSLQPNMTVAENIKFGKYNSSIIGLVNWKRLFEETDRFLRDIGFDDIDATKNICELSVAEGQKVEIAKALYRKPKILIMDEPSAVLPKNDLEKLHSILQRIKKDVGIIYISHHFEEIFKISDRISVLKDGKNVDTVFPSEINNDSLVKLMVGREIGDMYPSRTEFRNENVVLQVGNLSTTKLHDISFELREGEILGIAGLMGAGRTELCKAIFGLDAHNGNIEFKGRKVHNRTPGKAILNGFGYVTEDRHKTGLVLPMSVKNNISLVGHRKICNLCFVNSKKDKQAALEFIEKLKIVTPGMSQLVEFLSGGNQQKVVLAKWLFNGAEVLLLDEPTRGIDVGTKAEIYRLMKKLTNDGMSIIMVSSELPEIIGMSDRILVMYKGRIAGELSPEETSEEEILAYAAGLKVQNL